MAQNGIGNIVEFGILPIKKIIITSATMIDVDTRFVIANLLEGSTFQMTPITRQTQFGTDWTLGYNVDILARTAERPHRYFTAGFPSTGGVFLPQFITAGTSESLTLTVVFGNATLGTGGATTVFHEVLMPERVSRQAMQLAGQFSVTTDIVSGADSFLFGEIRIKGSIRNVPNGGGVFLEG